MSEITQLPVSLPPIMHMSSTEETASRGTLPQGKTMEKVIAVLSEFIKYSMQAAHNRLDQKHLSVEDLYRLSSDKQSKKFTESWVVGVLGGVSGLATIASGLGFVTAPWVQQLRPGLTVEEAVKAVKKAADGLAGVSRTGSDAFKTYQEGLIGEVDTRYMIQQSTMQTLQQASTSFDQSVTRTQELLTQITNSNSRAHSG